MAVSSEIHLRVVIHVYRLHVPLIVLIKDLLVSFGGQNLWDSSVLQVQGNKAVSGPTASHYLMLKFKLGELSKGKSFIFPFLVGNLCSWRQLGQKTKRK